jgi:hypothetical protein
MQRALAKGAVIFTLATPIASGCGPIEYLNQVGSKAASAVAAAKLAQADRYAPYEYTAAEEYLHKAREEAGYAQYQDSIEYGRKAEELAQRARAIAINKLSQPTASAPATGAPVPAAAAVPAAPGEPPSSAAGTEEHPRRERSGKPPTRE